MPHPRHASFTWRASPRGPGHLGVEPAGEGVTGEPDTSDGSQRELVRGLSEGCPLGGMLIVFFGLNGKVTNGSHNYSSGWNHL